MLINPEMFPLYRCPECNSTRIVNNDEPDGTLDCLECGVWIEPDYFKVPKANAEFTGTTDDF